MEKLIAELRRLYLPADGVSVQALAQHLAGDQTLSLSLVTDDRLVRAMVIDFPKVPDGGAAQHWTRLCEVAHDLQDKLALPAPAVSISGGGTYGLWLSLETPVPVAQAQQFLALLHQACMPDMPLRPDAAGAPVELPPCLHRGSGKWAAFIHPGMGASFAEDGGLEMAPPFAGQAGFLEGLKSISAAQFEHAVKVLQPQARASAAAPAQTPAIARTALPEGLLLKDATLEDIVAYLHAKNIEPTFRHLI